MATNFEPIIYENLTFSSFSIWNIDTVRYLLKEKKTVFIGLLKISGIGTKHSFNAFVSIT